ncbi:MAG TPA: metal-dependent hydrolase [Candidatus Saccharimonadales bacterium]|nr:metal-dependent hydrolase [Candidatus Saccharimonadales bacterium]
MVGRTHDLAAFTALTYVLTLQPIPQMSLATAIVAVGGNLLGGVAPDLDEPTSVLWNKIPTGSIIGRIIHPLLGSHRMISHSLLGLFLVGWLLKLLLAKISTVLLVNMDLVWWAFMIGYFSHLIADTVTKEGVPWFFPVPVRFGIPPFKAFRITTGAFVEKGVVFPGLLIAEGYLVYLHYSKFLEFFRHLVAK